MKTSCQRGLILKTKPSGEADVLSLILTNENCHYCVFKGLRKTKKRDIAANYPGTMIEFSAYEKNGKTPVVSDFSVIFFPSRAAASLENLAALNIFLEVLSKTTAEKDPHSNIFPAAELYLNEINASESSVDAVNLFILQILAIHGIMPDFSSCRKCGKNNSQMSFSTADRGLICASCAGEKIIARLSLGLNDVLYINDIRKNSHIITDEDRKRISLMLLGYMETYYHVEFMSKKLFGGLYD